MSVKDDLGQRMKENYENVSKTRLLRRTPVAIRIDGKAFHTFTNGFEKPFDETLVKAMQETTRQLCINIQGCIFGYCQSDEITLVLQDYKKLNTSAWFDYEVQKLCSISASMATLYFNKIFRNLVCDELITENLGFNGNIDPVVSKHQDASYRGAMFDARCFNVPKEEVANMLYWRQLDATRNSIQMVGQANFTRKELQNKSCNMVQDMLFTQKGINWNDYPDYLKRGTACIKDPEAGWILDYETPEFNKDWDYINQYVYCEKE